ncbi:MAG: hypothetical protein EXQ52_18000 [Bryobacterales bacterium]|nr:hypothetical protein [Bryobacterales bacterium]
MKTRSSRKYRGKELARLEFAGILAPVLPPAGWAAGGAPIIAATYLFQTLLAFCLEELEGI